MEIDICAFGPRSMQSYLCEGLPGQLAAEGQIQVRLHDFHDWSAGEPVYVETTHGKLLRTEPVAQCVCGAQSASKSPGRVILFSPQGSPFDQGLARNLAESPSLILVCGRLAGFEDSLLSTLNAEHISVGDYVLTSGEVAAMVVVDTVIRLIPGALPGKFKRIGRRSWD